jgi:hypothetical protein
VAHARHEARKGWYTYGYQWLILLNTEGTIQKLQKQLQGTEQKLSELPGWEEVEQGMFR